VAAASSAAALSAGASVASVAAVAAVSWLLDAESPSSLPHAAAIRETDTSAQTTEVLVPPVLPISRFGRTICGPFGPGVPLGEVRC
jgi:hypothetical protein